MASSKTRGAGSSEVEDNESREDAGVSPIRASAFVNAIMQAIKNEIPII